MPSPFEQGFPFWLAGAAILRGWALAEQGQGEEGIAQLRQGMAAWRATGAEARWPYFLTLLAEAYGKAGRPEEGLSMLAEALAVINKTGERFYEAELYRLKGQLTLQKFQVSSFKFQVEQSPRSSKTKSQRLTPNSPAEAEAEACFQKAIEIARKQSAKSLELRAATSLAHLWQWQGKKKKAHDVLVDIYNWFTEGFDTKDL